MGKRKYDSEKDENSKKSKKESISETEQNKNVDAEQPQNETKVAKNRRSGGFDVKYFRKEISGKQGQTMALTQFLQVCLNPDNEVDYMLEYLKCGGNSHEILRQITQENKKNLTLATPAFHLFHLIILKVQSSLPHMIAITEEACRYFLNTFMSTVEIMISENSGPRHRKVVLKLLTSMVTLNPDLGIEVLNQAPLTPKHLQHVVETSNYKEKDNVRRAFVHFMTSFLVDGHFPLIKALLEKQGLLGLVIPGLAQDEGEAVLMFLNILKKNIVDNTFITKSLKLKTFSHQVLHNLFKLFSWKGPPEQSQVDKNVFRPEIMTLLSEIVTTLFTSHKLGLYFIDNSLGTADVNKNQNLYKALLTLKRPWENECECEVILQIVSKCPDLHRAVVSVLEHSFEPQHSPIWERSVLFTIKLLDKLKPEEMISKMNSLNAVQIANFVRFITLPVPLLKYMNVNIGKDQVISLYCVKVLVKMLQTLRRYIQILDLETSVTVSDLKAKLEFFFPKHMPAPGVIVNLMDNVINGKNKPENNQDYKLPKISDTDALIHLIDLLLLYNDINPAFFETVEGNIDMKKILEHSMSLSEGQTSLLKFKVVSLWLTLDNSAISLKNPMFKDLFLIMLDVYTINDEFIWIEAKATMQMYFKNTGIFESDENEIHLILYALRNAKVHPYSIIGDVIEYVLENIKELTEYVRNQLVNFVMSDESSETALEKLFNDLMENRHTEDSVFLENKIPSPFIVGCMQYLQSHKEVKKNLKSFLSLYIANLLHTNYCPELTEVLIGDSKFDVRNYVASWIGEPVALPDIISEDYVLRNLSKSIISEELLSISEIFPCFEKVSDDGDIIIDGEAYKIDTAKSIDSSELFVWSKYLTFCIVRLANMGQLTEVQQKKIIDYFHCIIICGRKLHMIDLCRNIVLTLFKNPQVLKMFTPLDSGKNATNILATNLLLNIITQNKDIIDYLSDKHKLLKTYQQKNFNELVKAFVKINKKKNLDSDHTINVLNIVGLSKEDDVRVFNQIFEVNLENCVKEDKEPSVVLELLKYLMYKYSRNVTLELPPHVLKKCMKLYTDLLTNKEIICNLTNLEDSLSDYFENKPHQVPRIYDDFFKKFFEINNVRKSTSHLAYVLLKYNVKFCNIFKENIKNPEILSLRELTLPLGDAVINHNQFINDNKEVLTTINNEYKSNINKFIEKPHKAGQIYVSNWKFIKKLVIECMDVEECIKTFSKIHKFEVVELSHIHLLQSIFLKACVCGNVKKDNLINYFLSLLHVITVGLKEAKDADVLNDIIFNLNTIVEVSKIITELNVDIKEEFKRVTESSVWQSFCKVVLKDSLKVKTVGQGDTLGPKLLSLLNALVNFFYPSDHEDIVTLFDMVTSHSEFLNVILSYHSTDIKSKLIDFLYTLIRKNNTVMKTQQIPVFLSAYHATRSPCDRLILSVLYYYESHGLPVNEYKPYVWGDSAANHYAVRKNRSASLWAHPTPNQVLNLYEKDTIERTVRNFPVTQRLDYHYNVPSDFNDRMSVKNIMNNVRDNVYKMSHKKDVESLINNLIVKTKWEVVTRELAVVDLTATSHLDEDESIYDPVFLFPLLGHLLAPGSVASCFKLLRTGLLSVPVMALSSNCPKMRAAAYHVLHRFCMLLETETKHKNDKLFLTDFISTLRHSLANAITTTQNDSEMTDLKNPRLPAVDALYLARALMVSTAPSDPLYRPVNNFFIAKQVVDLTVVPDFLSLFHDSEVESVDRRLWILDIVRDGVKTMVEVNVIFKTMCLKMIMDFYSSVLSDRRVKERVIKTLSSVVAIPRASEILIENYGLLSWLHSVAKHLDVDRNLIRSIYGLITNILNSVTVNTLARNINAKNRNGVNGLIDLQVNRNVELEMLFIVYELLRSIECMDIEDVVSYVKIYKLISKRTRKNLNKNEMLYFMNKISGFLKKCDNTKILCRALSSNDAVLLKSVSNDMNFVSDDNFNQVLFNDVIEIVRDFIV